MILTCPACSARYLLAGDAIGESGRVVRCGKCGHSWDQPPVQDSLDELSRQGSEAFMGQSSNEESTQSQANDDLEETVEDVVAAFLNDTIPEGVKPLPPEPETKPAKAYKLDNPSKVSGEPGLLAKNLPLISGVSVAIAVFAVIVWASVLARAPIMSVLPFTKPAFVMLGVEEAGDADTLVFDGVSAKIEGTTLTVTGNLINLSASTMTLPPMVVEVLDATGKEIEVLPAPLEQKTLDGEQSLSLNLSFENIPDAAAQARLKFKGSDEKSAEPEEKASNEEPQIDPSTTDAADVDNTHVLPEGETDHPTAHE
jgi:predicted Zn finger-like uncharacterized protein